MYKKSLIFSTVLLLLLFGLAAYFLPIPHHKISIDTSQLPSIGNPKAPVHVILIEEFACIQCKRFHQEEFPRLQKEYIQTGKVRLTIIPLAFLEESHLPLLSLHCAAAQGITHFHSFIESFFSTPSEIFLSQSPRELLFSYARNYPEFSPSTAITCIKQTPLTPLLEKTHSIVAPIFRGEQIELPTLIINGRKATHITWENIKARIEEELLQSKQYVEGTKTS